jgi:RimJ/RimL family protein N-acetyltransferase
VTAVEHLPTGRLAGFTALEHSTRSTAHAQQGDTIVDPGHRGRRLGMLLKVANLRALADRRPGTRRIHTWNAEENAYMLAIHVALGFRPDGLAATWQRRLGA